MNSNTNVGVHKWHQSVYGVPNEPLVNDFNLMLFIVPLGYISISSALFPYPHRNNLMDTDDFFFQNLLHFICIKVRPWIPSTASSMSYVNCDFCEIPVTLSTKTFVTYIYVKPVGEHLSN